MTEPLVTAEQARAAVERIRTAAERRSVSFANDDVFTLLDIVAALHARLEAAEARERRVREILDDPGVFDYGINPADLAFALDGECNRLTEALARYPIPSDARHRIDILTGRPLTDDGEGNL